MKTKLSLPKKLAYTAFRLAVAGTLACGSESTGPDGPLQRADARPDTIVDAGGDRLVIDAGTDGCVTEFYCGPAPGQDGAACPGPICSTTDCPAGCELYG